MTLPPASGRFSLGVEQRLTKLGLELEFGSGFRPVVVEGPPPGRQELRFRLESAHKVAVVPLTPGSVDLAGLTGRVAWIEAADPVQLRPWVQFLQRSRDRLTGEGVGAVVLAADSGLARLISEEAPDLATILGTPVVLGEPSSEAAMAQAFCWLHISDLHVRDTDWRQDVVLDALVRDLPGLLQNAGLSPDVLLCTGDIAQSGRREEYLAARPVFEELLRILGLPARDRLFLVPGNHDVDRRRIDRPARAMQALFSGTGGVEEFNQVLVLPEELGLLGSRLGDYCRFTQDLLGAARAVSPDHPWRVDVYDHASMRVGIASLCSVLVAGTDNERHKLLLGERQVRDAVKGLAGCPLKVALLHHPVDWLVEEEEGRIRELLEAEFQVILHGHLHVPSASARLSGSGTSITSAAGATYTARPEWPRQVQAVVFDPGSGAVTVHVFSWSERQGGHWCRDSSGARNSADGVIRFQLPQLALSPGAPTDLSGLVERLARAAVQVLSPFDFVGINVAAHRPTAKLDDIYIPQQLETYQSAPRKTKKKGGEAEIVRESHERSVRLQLAEFRGRLLDDAQPLRAVVLGGPGLGKSTLCKYLAIEAARAGKAPLLIRLREFVRSKATDLRSYLLHDLVQRFAVQVQAEQLEALCADGQALLLVDGFDEVGRETERAAIRDAVVALSEAWPKVPVLCTSRIVGYDRAPLPKDFAHYQLRNFEKDDVRTFVARWYELAVASDPVDRQRRIADLLAALERTPAAMELASVPLLATLIALVHRYSANLPGNRSKLIEKVVETLTDTWPAERRRQFTRLTPDEQRRLLGALAWHMLGAQRRDSAPAGASKASIDLQSAVRVCADRLAKPEASDRGDKERLVEEWLSWTVEGTGVLVESAPEVLEFMHLSIAEYLAAQDWLARESAGSVDEVAQKLLKLAESRELYQVALYAAAVACGRFEGLAGRLVALAGDRGNLEVWLLDLVLEEAITDSKYVRWVTRAALKPAGSFRNQFGLGPILDALLAHDMRGSPDVVAELENWFADAADVAPAAIALRDFPDHRDRYTAILAHRRDAAAVGLALVAPVPDWAAKTLSQTPAGVIATQLPLEGTRYGAHSLAEVIAVAPQVGIQLALAWGADAGALVFRHKRTGQAVRLVDESRELFVSAPCPRGILWHPRNVFADLTSQYLLFPFATRIESQSTQDGPRSLRAVVGDESEPRRFIAQSLDGGVPPTSAALPDSWPPAFWHMLACLAGNMQMAATEIRGRSALATDVRPPWTVSLTTLALTNLWPTPDGKEPALSPADLATWQDRYLWRMCRWLEAPTDAQRAADVAVELAQCPAEYVGLREELEQWKVYPEGSPEYEAAVAEAKRKLGAKRKRANAGTTPGVAASPSRRSPAKPKT